MRNYRWLALILTCAVLYLGQGPLAAERAPDWLVGHYRGHNRKYNVDVELTIRPGGRVNSIAWFRDGRTEKDSGAYHDGKLTLNSGTFVITRADRGIRLVQTSDRDNVAFYRLVEGERDFHDDDNDNRGDRMADRIPDWLIGRFRGYNRKYRVDTELTIRPDGSVNSVNRFRDGRRSAESGSYRDGKIQVRSGTYYADRSRNGIRLTQTSDSDNFTEYRRID